MSLCCPLGKLLCLTTLGGDSGLSLIITLGDDLDVSPTISENSVDNRLTACSVVFSIELTGADFSRFMIACASVSVAAMTASVVEWPGIFTFCGENTTVSEIRSCAVLLQYTVKHL